MPSEIRTPTRLGLSSFQRRFLAIQQGRFGGLLGAAMTILRSVQRRNLSIFYRDRDGDWVNRQPEATLFDLNFNSVRPELVLKRVQDLWLYRRSLKPGDTVVDVGAGIGDDALIFSRMVGPTGKVIAIEAQPSTFRCLEKTVKANNLTNVVSLMLAVGDQEGNTKIGDSAGTHVTNRIGKGIITVRLATLDTVLAEQGVERPSLIKLNIEGAEIDALAGARKSLSEAEHWVVSCHDFIRASGFANGPPPTKSQVVQTLTENGFDIAPQREDPRPWVRDFVYATRTQVR
jgi:FkbM family methyltransferase